MLNLRKVDRHMHELNIICEQIRAMGIIVTEGTLLSHGQWVNFTSKKEGWSIWFSLDDLVSFVVPFLSGMVLSQKMKLHVIDLLISNGLGFIKDLSFLPVDDFIFKKISDSQDVDSVVMLKITSSEVPIWIERAPSGLLVPFKANMYSDIQWPVNIVLGATSLCLSTLSEVVSGDYLVVENIVAKICIFGKDIVFLNEKGGLKMSDGLFEFDSEREFQEISDSFSNNVASMMGDKNINDEDNLQDMKDLPVCVDFIIHNTSMSLQELHDIFLNKIFTLPCGVEKKVLIQINRKTIGKGELVQIDNHLAVEIQDWKIRKHNE